MPDPITISNHFCGPDVAGNGGYTSGVVASPLGRSAAVTLRAPTPLDTPLERILLGDRVELRAGGVLIAEAVPGRPSFSEVDVPRVIAKDSPVPALPAREHIFPRCFVCGPARAAHDGLRIMPGVVAGDDHVVATHWTPSHTLAPVGTPLPSELVWAALDCPGGWSFFAGETFVPMVLGRLVGTLDEPVLAGKKHTVVGWSRGASGRKRFAGSAILDGDRVLAMAQAVWFQVDAAAWQVAS